MCHRKDFSETNYYKSILILSFRYRTLFQKLYWENGGVWSFFGIFSDCLLSVFPSVCPYLNFSHFHLHLHSQWCNFNQTWHTASLPKGNSSLFSPFPRRDNIKNTLQKFKNFLLQNPKANFNQTGQNEFGKK